MTLMVLLLPYAVSFVYYGKIFVYARRLASQEAAERRHFVDGSVVLDNNIGPQEVTRHFFCCHTNSYQLNSKFLPGHGSYIRRHFRGRRVA